MRSPPPQLFRWSSEPDTDVLSSDYWHEKRDRMAQQISQLLRQMEEFEAREATLLRQLKTARSIPIAGTTNEASIESSHGSDMVAVAYDALADSEARLKAIHQELAERDERDVELRSAMAEALTQAEQLGEQRLQSALAYWLERFQQARTPTATHSVPTAPAPPAARSSQTPEGEQMELCLAEAAYQHEIELQQTAAFWISRMKSTKAALMAAQEELERVGDANGQLEEVVFALEAEHDAMEDRLEVQRETIALSSARLQQFDEALEAAALEHEYELQRTAAFWIARCKSIPSLEAEVSELRAALKLADERADKAEADLRALQ